MLLRVRLTILLISVVCVIVLGISTVVHVRDLRWEERYRASLLQTIGLAWRELNGDVFAELSQGAHILLEDPAWLLAWKNRDRPAIAAELDALVRNHPGWRADVYAPRVGLLHSTALEISMQELGKGDVTERALSEPGHDLTYFEQVDPQHYAWVHVERFGAAQERGGVLVLSLDASSRMESLAKTLGGDVAIMSMRGAEMAASIPGMLARKHIEVPVRRPWVFLHRSGTDGGTALRVVSQPLENTESRTIGTLVWMRDVSKAVRDDNQFSLWLLVCIVLAVMAVGGGVYWYLRRAFAPLSRSVAVLGALTQGRYQVAMDDEDEAAEDESGQIARGVALLRTEMLNLQMLRDERERTHRQQERLIREQMKSLAESLDASSRREILDELNVDDVKAGGNRIAKLAAILARMSGLVTTQQSRLLTLLKELQQAMETKAVLASLQQELEIARRMQLSILPHKPPDVLQVEIASTILPAREVGGDFYDYFVVDQHHLGVAVADVSGKGVPAAFFMAISRTLLKSMAPFLHRPRLAIEKLNDMLCEENEQMMFVTLFYGVLDLRTGQMRYVNAGHNPHLLLEREGGASFGPQGSNRALGVTPSITYQEGELTLRPGDTLLLYTDGVTEASAPDGRLFGEAALQSAMLAPVSVSAPLDACVRHLTDVVRAFEAGGTQADDITCVALRYLGIPTSDGG